MSDTTENLSLYKTDMTTDGNDYFDFDRDLNDNWEKIDAAIGKLQTNELLADLSNITATGLSQYNVFCVNTGEVDNSGNPAFLTASGGSYSTLTSAIIEEPDIPFTELSQITDGSMVISLNNETYTISDLDFSEIEDLAGAAEILQTAIRANTEGGTLWTNATVTYNEDEEEGTGSFTLTAGVIGAYDIGYASTAEEITTEEETTSVIGSDISSLIGWSEATKPTITIGEPLTLTTSGSFDVTTADGTIYTVTDTTLTYTANDLEDGDYNVYVNPVDLTLSIKSHTLTAGSAFPSDAASGDYLLNTSQVPYDLQEITITTTDEETQEETTTTTIVKGLNEVFAGTLTISSGGGN